MEQVYTFYRQGQSLRIDITGQTDILGKSKEPFSVRSTDPPKMKYQQVTKKSLGEMYMYKS